jgi:hypothetical protein
MFLSKPSKGSIKKGEEKGEDLVGWLSAAILQIQIMGGLCNGSQGWFLRWAKPGGKHPGRCILSLVADLGWSVMGLHSHPVGEEMLERHLNGQKMDGTWW